MQANTDVSDKGPSAAAVAAAQGCLENHNRIRLEYDIDVFTTFGHTAWLTHRTDVGICRINYEREDGKPGELVWYRQTFERLNWTQVGALRWLEGASLQALLNSTGKQVLLLHHKAERPVWDPEPGLDEVTVAVIERDTTELGHEELFMLIHEQTLAGTVEA